MSKHSFNRALLAMAVAVSCQWACGQSVPNLINYQGRLTDQTGTPLTNGNYGIQFRLWDSPTGTNLIWGQRQNVAVQANGTFNVMLGAPGGVTVTNPIPAVNDLAFAFGASDRFLGVKVVSSNGVAIASPVEILPRAQILSVPFAVSALHGVPAGTIVAFGGTNITEGWLLCDGRALSSVVYGRLFSAISTNWGAGGGTNDFSLPDLRGVFLRGLDKSPFTGASGRDPNANIRIASGLGGSAGNAVGSLQADATQKNGLNLGTSTNFPSTTHTHNPGSLFAQVSLSGGNLRMNRDLSVPEYNINIIVAGLPTGTTDEAHTFGTVIGGISGPPSAVAAVALADGDSETRPINVSVQYIIKY